VARYDGHHITTFPQVEGLLGRDIYFMMRERSGAIWICPVGLGAYRYDGQLFQLFQETDRNDLIQNFAIQSGLEDKSGQLWFGFSGGLFKFDGTRFLNVTKGGLGM
jgi:ligand-binding sensor domain-containing protein